MAEDRISRALVRIEAAAARIEKAAAAPRGVSDPDLADRHEKLRRDAWAALAELDTLIETIEP